MYISTNLTVTPGTFDPISFLTNLSVEAIDIIEHTASFGDDKVEVILTGASATTDVHFVLITASSYLEEVGGTYNLDYRVDADTNQAIQLGTWHLWSAGMDEGMGATGLVFDSIFVSNGHSDTDSVLTIYVGRDS